ASGTVYFDELRIGDKVEIESDRLELAKAIQDANALRNHSVEGVEEGQFAIGSKAILQSAIDVALTAFNSDSLTNKEIDQAIAGLYDACMDFEAGVVVKNIRVVDALATKETKYLFTNLVLLSKNNLLFGHQDDTAYGIGWWDADARSDIFDVCGSYPAVYGWELGKLELGQSQSLDGVDFKRIKFWIRAAYQRGGINTISWHSTNPFSGGSAWDKTPAVASILPGGVHHEKFKSWLDQLATFFKSLRAENGNSIPIIFRPFHEHLGNWFWWGRGNCSAQEYNQIWQFTFDYLIKQKNVHNLLFAISPSPFKSEAEYLERYPGDDYVDVLGVDDYENYYSGSYPNNGFKMLRTIVEMADERNKIAALTEVGFSLNDPTCWIKFLRALKSDTTARQICYVHVWRNANTEHFFAPYPGQVSAPDFVKFHDDPFTLFEADLPDVYQLNTDDQTPPAFTLVPPRSFTAYDDSVTLKLTTNERAFVRYGPTDQPYPDMPFEFQQGQGGTRHSTIIWGEQGQTYTFFIRAIDPFGNAMDTSAVVSFTIDTSLQPISWQDPLYDCSAWKMGRTALGYGTGEAITTIARVRTVYFRKEFSIASPAAITYLTAILKYDNGAVVYLNGHEIERINMPSSDIYYPTWASDNSSGYRAVSFDADDLGFLKAGNNIIAVEMHQNPSDSSDLIFDLRLINPDPVIEFSAEWYYNDSGQQPEDQTIGASIDKPHGKLPHEFKLNQNYPNPFNSLTAISYQLSGSSFVEVAVYNLSGEKVNRLVNEKQDVGYHLIQFDASGLASGIYFYQIKAGDYIQARKMIVLR
ncbi:T9SS type A sorting domain-containing protein, partial [candidate division KSB1 bacterium]|nr:T9SS type A sorting domain-containing protein [candidate division KSB1 bacterium]